MCVCVCVCPLITFMYIYCIQIFFIAGKGAFIIFLCLAKLTTQYPVTTRETTIDDGNANTYDLTTQQEGTITTTPPSDITEIQV